MRAQQDQTAGAFPAVPALAAPPGGEGWLGVLAGLPVRSKKELLAALARLMAERTGLAEPPIAAALRERERLGSTGVGEGVALPHARLPGIDGFHALFVRLDRPVDFQAADGQPVDLVFLLLCPEEAPGALYVQVLSRISGLFHDRAAVRELRRQQDPAALERLLHLYLG